MRTERCPLCGESCELRFPAVIDSESFSAYTYASRKRPELMHFDYFECRDCQHLFSVESIDADELIARYRDAAYDSSLESAFAARTYLEVVRSTGPLRGASVLDIGCGDGAFLLLLRREEEVALLRGIEPSAAPVATASPEVRESIFITSLEEYRTEERFDVVTFFQTIEHVQDPLRFIGLMADRVKEGGRLVIVAHDWTSLVNRILGTRSPIFDIEHLQLFSRNSLEIALTKAGATSVTVEPIRNIYPLSYWLKLSPPPLRWLEAVLPAALTTRLPIGLRVGNMVAVARFD